MSVSLKTNFAGIEFKNPVVLASGTCGFGREYHEIIDLQKLGGISSKGLTLNARAGNDGIRIWETPSGIMNSVGLENPGVKGFIEHELDWINHLDLVNIVNLGGHSIDDYIHGVELLNEVNIDILELNISCPNVKAGGMNFGIKTEVARDVVKTIRKICKHPLVIKLSPNAEDIAALAKACEDEGADGISLINTVLGMAIDIRRRKPIFENTYAGLSGPAIKPIALRMVHQVSKAVNIPIMGIGGITTWQDAVEFIMAGASVVQIGTASFMNPQSALDIVSGIEQWMASEKISSLDDIRNIV
jgi:dihydroorotate dehydrogenase (NAD+) catalytic subunit